MVSVSSERVWRIDLPCVPFLRSALIRQKSWPRTFEARCGRCPWFYSHQIRQSFRRNHRPSGTKASPVRLVRFGISVSELLRQTQRRHAAKFFFGCGQWSCIAIIGRKLLAGFVLQLSGVHVMFILLLCKSCKSLWFRRFILFTRINLRPEPFLPSPWPA